MARTGAAVSFTSLLELHERLQELFLRHQEALVEGDLDAAAQRLDRFQAALELHAQNEETWLIPVYRRAERVAGGAPEIFQGEHLKMLHLVRQFRAALSRIRQSGQHRTRRVLQLLDDESKFKQLMAHHDARERTLLYPILDRLTTDEERRELLERCRRELPL